MTKVSIIVPVFNTDKYLSECLDSIINQTFKDIEIICINDGSTDDSLKILDEYERKDSRLKVFSQENQGLAASRNAGLKLASGEFVYFMDSDDILEITAIEELFMICEEKDLDMLLFKLINFDDETKEKSLFDYYEMNFLNHIVGEDIFNYEDIKNYLFEMAVSAPGKFFKRTLISDITFPEGLIFEDNPFFMESIFKANRIYFYNKHLYNRRVRNNSITTLPNLSFADTITISNIIIDIAKKYNHYNELKESLFDKKIRMTYVRFSQVDDKYKEEFFKRIQNDFSNFKQEIETDIKLSSKNKFIFESAFKCENYSEYEYFVDYFIKKEDEIKALNRNIRSNEIARIKIQNIGNEQNSIQILSDIDENSTETTFNWFKDAEGKGFVVESYSGKLNLKIKIINDGKLRLVLENIKKTNKIDYTSSKVNDEIFLKNHNLHGLDKPFKYERDVKNSEMVNINVEWSTYDNMNGYVEEIMLKEKEIKGIHSSNSSRLKKPLRFLKNL